LASSKVQMSNQGTPNSPEASSVRLELPEPEYPVHSPRGVLETQRKNRFRGEVAFCIGVINTHMTMWMFGAQPLVFVWYYTIKAPILLMARAFLYYKERAHYFLFDFCYFANVFLVLTLWYPFKTSIKDDMFMIIFALVNGPLLWAIMTFRNSLVFHSVDRITSVFIHLTPALVTHAVRFDLADDFNVCTSDCNDLGHILQTMWVLAPLCFIAHVIVYAIVINGLCMTFNKSLADESDEQTIYWTSLRFLTRNPKSTAAKYVNMCGPKMAPVMFAIVNCVYAIISILPTVLYYHYRWVHFVALCFFGGISVWNGATFYYQVFSQGKGTNAI